MNLPCTVAIVVAAVLSVGCRVHPPTIHADFATLRPATIRVAPVENGTIHPNLQSYSTAGLLQRLLDSGELLAPGKVDVLAAIGGSVMDEVQKKGFAVVAAAASPEGELRVTLRRWKDDSSFSGRGIDMMVDVALVRVDSGETLFHRTYPYRIVNRRNAGGPLTAGDLRRGIARAVRAVLGPLPAAGDD